VALCTNQGFKNIICTEKLFNRYLFHVLRASIEDLESQGRGNTFLEIPGKIVREFTIPLPPLDVQRSIAIFLDAVYQRLNGQQLELPELPAPLAEQRRIVARIEELAAKIEEARGLRRQAVEEVQALFTARITDMFGNLEIRGRLGDILCAKPRNGWSARCDNLDGGIPVLTLSAVTGFQYREDAFKRTSEATSPDAYYWLQEGDLLITRSNTPELVGHVAIYNGKPSPCIYPDLMMKLVVNSDLADRDFVHVWLQSGIAREFIRRSAKGTSPTMKKISQEVVMSIPFPSTLSPAKQRHIVSYLDSLQTKVDALKALQAETQTELDAMLPSVLDKAFKGEI